VIKTLAVATALLVSCAAPPEGPQPLGASPTSAETVYRHRESGDTIRIGADFFETGGKRVPLRDCSTAEWTCARTETGFSVTFPRVCPQSTWFGDGEGSVLRSVQSVAHSAGGVYVNRGDPVLRYFWDPPAGLTFIEADAETENARRYWKVSGPERFGCARPAKGN
jgi:hypothetical protein